MKYSGRDSGDHDPKNGIVVGRSHNKPETNGERTRQHARKMKDCNQRAANMQLDGFILADQAKHTQ